jgi:hypothetical protein
MTDGEYERLSAVVESEGMTLGEWCREVLLERADGRKPSVIEETLLAEVLALRTILLNLHFTVATRRRGCRRSSSGPTPTRCKRSSSGWQQNPAAKKNECPAFPPPSVRSRLGPSDPP